jgi:hypothetical protein
MKESYRKGVANHPDPYSCEGGREVELEALGGGTCRLGIPEVDELRNSEEQSADGVTQSGRQHGGARRRECAADSAESQTPGMHGNFTHENRETLLPSDAARRGIGGRKR